MRVSEKLAKQFGVSEKTVRNAGKFAEEMDSNPELKQWIDGGKSYHKWKQKKFMSSNEPNSSMRDEGIDEDAETKEVIEDGAQKAIQR